MPFSSCSKDFEIVVTATDICGATPTAGAWSFSITGPNTTWNFPGFSMSGVGPPVDGTWPLQGVVFRYDICNPTDTPFTLQFAFSISYDKGPGGVGCGGNTVIDLPLLQENFPNNLFSWFSQITCASNPSGTASPSETLSIGAQSVGSIQFTATSRTILNLAVTVTKL